MKEYTSLGDLLIDYRSFSNISQIDFAGKLNVDIRTVIRWEKGESLVKSEKEKDLVEQTFIPYQVIHNLNAAVPIPVFYDFVIRKYSMSEISVGMPETEAFKAHLDIVSPRIHSLLQGTDKDIENILHFHQYLYKSDLSIGERTIVEAAKILPELNLIMYDNAGYYAGHCVVFPLRNSKYDQLKNRDILEGDLKETDFVNPWNEELPSYHFYSMYADCNENLHYMMNYVVAFLKDHKKHFLSSLVVRPDGLKLMLNFGLKKVWEDRDYQSDFGKDFYPTLVEGNLSELIG